MTKPYAAVLDELLVELGPLFRFFFESRYAERQTAPDIADLVAGNPHDPPLAGLVDAIRSHVEPTGKDHFAYKLNEESPRRAVAASLQAERGIAFDPDDVFLTPGTFGALSVALRTVIDPGDEVIYLSPPWFFYRAMIRVAAGVPVRVDTPPPAFDLDVDAIAAAITPRTRGIIVNSPNNPTGRIYPAETLEALGSLLSEVSARNGRTVYLLSDESYCRILFDGNRFVTPAAHYPNTFVMYTYGKQLLAPGARVGFLALPPAMPDRETLRTPIVLSQIAGGWQFPNAVLQFALADLDPLSVDIARLQQRRDRLIDALREIGYEVHVPESTFYVLPRAPIADDGAFTAMLAERDVFVLPGSVFELPGYIRLSVTANDDMIERAIPGLREAFKRARG